MIARAAALADRLRHSALAVPAALLLAVLMLAVNEAAHHGAHSRLERLVEMGRARVLLLQALQRTTDAESGKRGYLLTDGREYLQPYQAARSDVLAGLQQLDASYATFADARARHQLAALEETIRAKLSEMDEVLRLYDAGRRDAALDMVRSGIGRDLMTRMRDEGQLLVAGQNERIAHELDEVFDTLLLNRVAIGAMTLMALAAAVMFVRLGRQLERQRADQQRLLQAERDRLEQEVARRTADLTELARHLQTAREDERARLARDLHDELGALLTAAKLDVARIKPRLLQAAPELEPRLAHLIESLNSGIALKRNIIEDLRPSTLGSLGLVPALEILCTEFADRSGLAVTTELQAVPLAPGAELTVFRLVQEALTNAAKYASARRLQVRLQPQDGGVQVLVADDGVGFDPQAVPRTHQGLKGMRFRVEAERGRFTLRSAPGQGTHIAAWLPTRPAA